MATEADPRDILLAFLDFHVANGFEIALDDAPRDRFAAFAAAKVASADVAEQPALERAPRPPVEAGIDGRPAPSLPAAPASTRALPAAATAPPEVIAAEARRLAATARTLDELAALMAAFDGCALKATARQLVFADGRAGADVMIVGEAPGGDEDRTGRPFVGPDGQFLDRMLAAIRLGRQDVYMANLVPWAPPGNRMPTPVEIAICLPFIIRQIALARPRLLVTVGACATQSLTSTKGTITRTRGQWLTYSHGEEGKPGPRVLPMLEPAYLRKRPVHKRFAWRDLRLLRRTLDGEAASAGGSRVEPGPAAQT